MRQDAVDKKKNEMREKNEAKKQVYADFKAKKDAKIAQFITSGKFAPYAKDRSLVTKINWIYIA